VPANLDPIERIIGLPASFKETGQLQCVYLKELEVDIGVSEMVTKSQEKFSEIEEQASIHVLFRKRGMLNYLINPPTTEWVRIVFHWPSVLRLVECPLES